MHTYQKTDLNVTDVLIKELAKDYIAQRTESRTSPTTIIQDFLLGSIDFDPKLLERIITRNVITDDLKREQGQKPEVIRDIYRSDLGELLLTRHFENGGQFRIPVKNISSRELAGLPGRGLDAIGYRLDGSRIKLLFGEAKVSESSVSPPPVVHQTADSIYKTHLKHVGSLAYANKKLSEYYKRLTYKDAAVIGMAIYLIGINEVSNIEVTLGCALVRDQNCVNETGDYGKMKSDSSAFSPHIIHFTLLSFTGKTINETVQLFYEEVNKQAA